MHKTAIILLGWLIIGMAGIAGGNFGCSGIEQEFAAAQAHQQGQSSPALLAAGDAAGHAEKALDVVHQVGPVVAPLLPPPWGGIAYAAALAAGVAANYLGARRSNNHRGSASPPTPRP